MMLQEWGPRKLTVSTTSMPSSPCASAINLERLARPRSDGTSMPSLSNFLLPWKNHANPVHMLVLHAPSLLQRTRGPAIICSGCCCHPALNRAMAIQMMTSAWATHGKNTANKIPIRATSELRVDIGSLGEPPRSQLTRNYVEPPPPNVGGVAPPTRYNRQGQQL